MSAFVTPGLHSHVPHTHSLYCKSRYMYFRTSTFQLTLSLPFKFMKQWLLVYKADRISLLPSTSSVCVQGRVSAYNTGNDGVVRSLTPQRLIQRPGSQAVQHQRRYHALQGKTFYQILRNSSVLASLAADTTRTSCNKGLCTRLASCVGQGKGRANTFQHTKITKDH